MKKTTGFLIVAAITLAIGSRVLQQSDPLFGDLKTQLGENWDYISGAGTNVANYIIRIRRGNYEKIANASENINTIGKFLPGDKVSMYATASGSIQTSQGTQELSPWWNQFTW